jgi:UDP-2,3-diacylglucosamine hydrolase
MNPASTIPPTPVEACDIDQLGLIACGGRMPFLLVDAAHELGIPVTAFAIKGVADPDIENQVDKTFWIELGQFTRFIELCHENKIRYVAMAGRVPHNSIWRYRGFDKRSLRVLGRLATRRADSILGSVVKEIHKEGIHVVESPLLLGGCMPKKGLLTPKRPLTNREEEDIDFGFPLARKIAGMDIGQTIVVKDLAVVAVESLEGTDETIVRAGRIAQGDIVVIKVCKPHQDSRFDIPVIGPATIQSIVKAGGGCLVVMADNTLFFDQKEAIELAHENNIGIIAI